MSSQLSDESDRSLQQRIKAKLAGKELPETYPIESNRLKGITVQKIVSDYESCSFYEVKFQINEHRYRVKARVNEQELVVRNPDDAHQYLLLAVARSVSDVITKEVLQVMLKERNYGTE